VSSSPPPQAAKAIGARPDITNILLRFPRLLLTGAAGGLGRALRPRLKAYATRCA
jgi:hypothetical protein